jgi:hypothetical protein
MSFLREVVADRCPLLGTVDSFILVKYKGKGAARPLSNFLGDNIYYLSYINTFH